MPLEQDPRVSLRNGGRYLTVLRSVLSVDHNYTFTARVEGRVEAHVEVRVVGVITCKTDHNTFQQLDLRLNCWQRAQQLATCSDELLGDYCISLCVHHSVNTTCTCDSAGAAADTP